MSKQLKYILLSFLFLGTMVAAAMVQQTLLVQEDTSDVKPRKFEDDFKEDYTSNDYVYEIEQTDGWFSRLADWLKATIKSIFDLDSNGEATAYLENIKLIIYAIIIILVVYFIVKAVMNGEGRWVFGKRSDKRKIQYEDVETDIHNVDFNKLVSKAETEDDYRSAVRFQYLNMLKKMSAAEIIDYDPEKTNLDYANEINNETLRAQFQYASYVYNYVWYGEFMIDKSEYEQASETFSVLLKNTAA
jgi:hypothetical protein